MLQECDIHHVCVLHTVLSVSLGTGRIKTDTKVVMDVFTFVRCHSGCFLCFFCSPSFFRSPFSLCSLKVTPLPAIASFVQVHHLNTCFYLCNLLTVSRIDWYFLLHFFFSLLLSSDWTFTYNFGPVIFCFLLPAAIRWHLRRYFAVISGKYIVWSVDEHEIKAAQEAAAEQVAKKSRERKREMRWDGQRDERERWTTIDQTLDQYTWSKLI